MGGGGGGCSRKATTLVATRVETKKKKSVFFLHQFAEKCIILQSTSLILVVVEEEEGTGRGGRGSFVSSAAGKPRLKAGWKKEELKRLKLSHHPSFPLNSLTDLNMFRFFSRHVNRF